MDDLFKKVSQNRIFQDVVEQIQDAILDGKILPGERLPAERELCERLNTSRGTLREALRILEQKGLLEIKVGVNGGAIVREATFEQMEESLALLIRSQVVSLNHLAEFREGVESTVAALAAQRAQPEDIEQLNQLLEDAKTFQSQGLAKWSDFVKVDEQIHMLVAKISGNPIYRHILETVHANIERYYDKYLTMGEEELDENYWDLRLIVKAISENSPEMASSAAREHVKRFSRYMENKIRA